MSNNNKHITQEQQMAATLLGYIIEQHGYTQTSIAKVMGIRQSKVSFLVNRKLKPTEQEAAALEELFGFPVEQLLAPLEGPEDE